MNYFHILLLAATIHKETCHERGYKSRWVDICCEAQENYMIMAIEMSQQ